MKKVFLSDSGPVTSDSIYSFWRWIESSDLNVSNIEDITNFCLELGINSFDEAVLKFGSEEYKRKRFKKK